MADFLESVQVQPENELPEVRIAPIAEAKTPPRIALFPMLGSPSPLLSRIARRVFYAGVDFRHA
jgi:hypothetical protein